MSGVVGASIAALIFSLLGVLHLIWPHKVKQGTDYLARKAGTLAFTSHFDNSYYRLAGWVYGVCAVAMFLGAVVLFLD